MCGIQNIKMISALFLEIDVLETTKIAKVNTQYTTMSIDRILLC